MTMPDHSPATPALAAAQLEARPGRLAESIEAHLLFATLAADAGARLVIFPELSLTSYDTTLTLRDAIDPDHPALRPLGELARRRGIVVVAGAPLASERGLLIGSVIFRPDAPVTTYTKRYLHHSESPTFAAGEGGALLPVAGRSVGLAICAEVNHPAHVVDTVASGAQVYAASCFLSPGGYDRDFRRLTACAGTHRLPVLMANFADSAALESAGGTAAWDDTGRLLAAAPRTGECVVAALRDDDGWVGRIIER